MSNKEHIAIGLAILAAVFYAIKIPCSKALLADTPPTMMATFLYIGAGIGMGTMMLAISYSALPACSNVIFSLYSVGDRPVCCLTNFPKKARLGKRSWKAISFIDLLV